MSDLDLIDWYSVAEAVISAADERKVVSQGIHYEIPADAAKRTALSTIDVTNDMNLLRDNGFQSIGGYWCRIENGAIATYTRDSAVRRLKKETDA